MNKETVKLNLAVLGLIIFLVVSIIKSISIGAVDISWENIVKILYYKLVAIDTLTAHSLLASTYGDVIFDLRLPRIIMAAICGSSLALSGVVMQAVVRNPLADPYILGVSSGAAMGATAGIVLGAFSFFGIYGVSLGAFIGAVVVTFTAFTITFSSGSSQNMTRLILTGTALNAICSACTSMILYLAKDADGIRDVTFWIMGSMARASWNILLLNLVIFCICCVYFLYQFRILNTSLLGDEMATILGIDLEAKRKVYLVLISVLVSSVVSASGIIGFVGLVIPHIVRVIYGNNHIKLLPVAIIIGAIYMIWCDIFARAVLVNTEIPIGILTSLIGGPFFLYLMISKKYGYGEK